MTRFKIAVPSDTEFHEAYSRIFVTREKHIEMVLDLLKKWDDEFSYLPSDIYRGYVAVWDTAGSNKLLWTGRYEIKDPNLFVDLCKNEHDIDIIIKTLPNDGDAWDIKEKLL